MVWQWSFVIQNFDIKNNVFVTENTVFNDKIAFITTQSAF